MKKMRLASLTISAFAIGTLGLATVAPAASAYNYRYNNHHNNRYDRYNRYDNNRYHRDYNRYSGDHARGWFQGRYPHKKVVYVVVVYKISNHNVYRVHCNDGSWADYDGWDGREVNRRVY